STKVSSRWMRRRARTWSRSTSTGCASTSMAQACRSSRCADSAMSSRRAESLRLQLLRWLLLPLLVLLAVNGWLSSRASISTANLAFDRLLEASADAISDDVEVKDGEIVVDLPYAALQRLESNMQERIFYRVVGPDGKTVTGYDDLPLPRSLDHAGEAPVRYAAEYGGEVIHLVAMNKQMYGVQGPAPIVIIVA